LKAGHQRSPQFGVIAGDHVARAEYEQRRVQSVSTEKTAG
jgi:hypothetical protein